MVFIVLVGHDVFSVLSISYASHLCGFPNRGAPEKYNADKIFADKCDKISK